MRPWVPLCLLLWAGLGCGGGSQAVAPVAATAREPSVDEQAPHAPAAEPPAQPVAGRPASAAELQMVAELSRTAERIRGLRFVRPVEVRVQNAIEMKRFVEGQIEDDELEVARQRYVMLGLLDAELDVRRLLLDLMEEQLVGYYDPDHAMLAIRDDFTDSLVTGDDPQRELTLRTVVLHELVHALQDQHFDLKTRLEEERTTDADAAVSAVVEGDATLAMLAYALEGSGTDLDTLLHNPALLGRLLASGMGGGGGQLARAPAIVREPLLFPYREGAAFVAELVRQGGWAAVDAVHRVPPPSGGHILWPERELRHRATVHLDPSLPGALEADDVTPVDEDELGPYETGLFFEALGGQPGLTRHWVADHLWQVELAGRPALAWLLAFDGSQAAKRAEALISQQPAFRVTRVGPRVVLLRNLDGPRAEALAAELGERRPAPVLDGPAAGN